MEVFTELVDEFDSVYDEINKFIAKHNSLNDEQQLFVKDRITRCHRILQGYKVELRFCEQTKNVLLNNQLLSMDAKLNNLIIDQQFQVSRIPRVVTTDDILSKADKIQKKDIALLEGMCKMVHNLAHK
jgi:hypothetical protein